MATLTLDLPEDTAAFFAALSSDEQAQISQQFNIYAAAVINQKKADTDGMNGIDPEDAKWWRSLSPARQDEERAILARGLADIDAGRISLADEVYARIRAKYAKQAA